MTSSLQKLCLFIVLSCGLTQAFALSSSSTSASSTSSSSTGSTGSTSSTGGGTGSTSSTSSGGLGSTSSSGGTGSTSSTSSTGGGVSSTSSSGGYFFSESCYGYEAGNNFNLRGYAPVFYQGYFYEPQSVSLNFLSHPLGYPNDWKYLDEPPRYCLSGPGDLQPNEYATTVLENCGSTTYWFTKSFSYSYPHGGGWGYALKVWDWGQNNKSACQGHADASFGSLVTSCPTWKSQKTWLPGDIVKYQSSKYFSKDHHEDLRPPSQSDHWTLVNEHQVKCNEGVEPILPNASGCPIFTKDGEYNTGDVILYRGKLYEALRDSVYTAPTSEAPLQWWKQTNKTCFTGNVCVPPQDLNALNYSEWSSVNAYVFGDTVRWNDLVWKAKWWNMNEAPGSASQAWELISEVITSWDSGSTYQAGDQVNYAERRWQAQWWSQGNTPGLSDVWLDVGEATCELTP